MAAKSAVMSIRNHVYNDATRDIITKFTFKDGDTNLGEFSVIFTTPSFQPRMTGVTFQGLSIVAVSSFSGDDNALIETMQKALEASSYTINQMSVRGCLDKEYGKMAAQHRKCVREMTRQ